MARKKLEDDEKVKALKGIAIAAAEQVYHYKLIAMAVARDQDTLIRWRKEDPVFSESLQEARFRFLNKRIKSSKPEFILERLEPKLFKQRSEVKHSGTIKRDMSEDELDAIIERAARSKASTDTQA